MVEYIVSNSGYFHLCGDADGYCISTNYRWEKAGHCGEWGISEINYEKREICFSLTKRVGGTSVQLDLSPSDDGYSALPAGSYPAGRAEEMWIPSENKEVLRISLPLREEDMPFSFKGKQVFAAFIGKGQTALFNPQKVSRGYEVAALWNPKKARWASIKAGNFFKPHQLEENYLSNIAAMKKMADFQKLIIVAMP